MADAIRFAHFDVVGHLDRGRLGEFGRADCVGPQFPVRLIQDGLVQSYMLFIVMG